MISAVFAQSAERSSSDGGPIASIIPLLIFAIIALVVARALSVRNKKGGRWGVDKYLFDIGAALVGIYVLAYMQGNIAFQICGVLLIGYGVVRASNTHNAEYKKRKKKKDEW